ncbi:MBG domain-containing protein [Mucilaginibacter sp. BT774]|uniref:MBG domain-containing protein n=1 Tax=Mucilaginibacter sp. BT774 TaxID=3062276 RepID=UPI00267609F2|nr:MBG domain-containing protein [Mucilaginibacter sp. BT774]MDO3629048.1 MBG domain-containing protein [Mucilaginibacter sp. BT774]
MVIKYLLATLSALAQRFTSSEININNEGNALAFNKGGINYLNVSTSFGRFRRRRRKIIDLLPKSIIMAMVLIVLSSAKLMAATITVVGNPVTLTATTITYGSPVATSTIQFTLSGSALTGNIVIAAPPAGFEMSLNSATGPFVTTSINLVPSGGSVASTTIYLRLTSTATAGTHSGTISITSPTATTRTITINNSTVNKLTITESGASVSNKTYDATTTATVSGGTLSGVINGDVVSINTTGTFASANVANNIAVTVTLTGANAGNYTLTNPGITANITGAPLTITATGPSKSYGTALTAGNYSTNFTATGMVGTQTVTNVTLTPDAAGLSSSTPQGSTYVVTPSGGTGGNGFLASNYNITYLNFSGTVTGAILTITATSFTQTYGSVDLSVITFTYSGWIGSDSPSSMIVVPSISTTALSSSGAGSYPITVSGGQAPAYYTINYVQGTFTISKASLTIVSTGPPKVAGSAVTSPQTSSAYFTASGLVGSESISTVTLTISPSTSQTAGQTYTVTPSSPTGSNGFDVNNYNITYTAYSGQCGQNYTWTGATNTTWSTTTNWSPNGTPGTNDNVFIPATTTKPTVTASTNVNTITFTGSNTLTINTGINILFYNGFTVNSGVTATINMVSTSSQLQVGNNTSHAIMDNLGTLTVNGGTVFINWGLNYIYNETNAVMTFHGGNTLNIGGTSGQLAFQNNGFFFAGTSNSACTLNIVNSQSVINGAQGNFYLGSTSSINFNDAAAHDSHFTNTAGGNFTIQSDQFGTGSIGKIPNNPGTHQNSFDGLFTVERYVSGVRGYRLFASPVYAATSGSNKVYSLNYTQNSAYISGTNSAGGFDKVSNGPTIYLWREDVPASRATFSSGNFRSINDLTSGNSSTPTYTFDLTSGSYSLPVSNAFLFYYRGDRNSATYTKAQQFTVGAPAEPTTFSTTGYLTQQQVVFRDWYTSSSSNLGCTNPDTLVRGFNLAANPYACSIDWNTQQSSSTTTGIYALNLATYIYEFNPRTNNYDTYYSNGTYTNNGTRTIMSGQGFFVVALNSSAQLIFNESAKSTTLQNTGFNLLMGKPADELAKTQSLRIELMKDTINKDNIFIAFNPNAKTALDIAEDAPYKPGTGKVNLASMSSDNHALSVNILPFNKQGQTIPLRVGATASGDYQLNLLEVNAIPKLFDILLVDKFKNDTTDMRQNSSYSFALDRTDTNTYGSKRFAIIMRQNPVYAYQLLNFNAQKVPSAREVQVVWDTKYEENYTNFTVERSVDGGNTFTVLGGVPSTGAGNYGFLDKNPVAGMNLYRLRQEDINSKISYSPIIPIGYAVGANNFAQNGINIYPNPAAGRINLAIATPIASAAPSSYSILITNSSGNMLKKVTSNQPYWQGDATGWMPGTYMVKVYDAKTQSLIGTTKFIKL